MSIAHPATTRHLAIVLGMLAALTAHATVANAQSTGGGNPANPGGPTSGSGVPAAGGGGGGATGGGGGSTTTIVTSQGFPGGVAPPPPGGTLGGGNAQFSSSKPISGNERDTFDFKRGGGGGTAHGSDSSSFILGGGGGGGEFRGSSNNAGVHQVRKGDTLWDICDHYFRNPYQWPRIWAFNPQIQNPHWIFPGDQVRLRGASDVVATAQTSTGGSQLIDRHRTVPPETVFLRNEGFIDDDTNNWGEISGSPEEKMILTDNDEVYLRIAGAHDLKIGQELTIYRPLKSVGGGKLIEIQGTAKVDQYNAQTHVGRAKIVEALDAIERGARVGPIARKFEVVPPARNESDVASRILTSVQPHGLFGQNQIVFVNQGEEAGLKPGNRMFVIRKGDAWHQTLTTGSSAKRIALEDDSPAATENVPKPRDASKLPEEVLAELRVINVRKKTAMCIVIQSRHEIEAGDQAIARKGF
jgi:hypothetical protein